LCEALTRLFFENLRALQIGDCRKWAGCNKARKGTEERNSFTVLFAFFRGNGVSALGRSLGEDGNRTSLRKSLIFMIFSDISDVLLKIARAKPRRAVTRFCGKK
jgi:hypothetical protein